MNVDSFDCVLAIHVAPIFIVKVCIMGEFLRVQEGGGVHVCALSTCVWVDVHVCIIGFMFQKDHKKKERGLVSHLRK